MKRAAWAALFTLAAGVACQGPVTATPGQSPAVSSCPLPPTVTIHSLEYRGTGPFYVGALAASLAIAGDLNKIPWAVAASYVSQVTITGKKSDGSAIVNFGVHAQQPGVPVSFQRTDQVGQMWLYQPRLIVDATPGTAFMREGALFWSFPTSGCYEVAADGTKLRERIYLQIGIS